MSNVRLLQFKIGSAGIKSPFCDYILVHVPTLLGVSVGLVAGVNIWVSALRLSSLQNYWASFLHNSLLCQSFINLKFFFVKFLIRTWPARHRQRGILFPKNRIRVLHLPSHSRCTSAGLYAEPAALIIAIFSIVRSPSPPSPLFSFGPFPLQVQLASSTVNALTVERYQLSSRWKNMKGRLQRAKDEVSLA